MEKNRENELSKFNEFDVAETLSEILQEELDKEIIKNLDEITEYVITGRLIKHINIKK